MRLTVLGCSGSTSGPESPASCYLVQAPHAGRTFSLVLDLGPGAFGRLWQHLDARQVDAVALSHLHPDHCLDVCALYVAARYSDPGRPWPGIPLYGPAGAQQRIGSAYRAPGEVGTGIEEHFAYRTWAEEQRIGPFLVATTLVAHSVPAYAIRVTEDAPGGRSLVYSGDTGPCPELVDLARGAELLLAEAAFLDRPDNPPNLHLTGRDAAAAATSAGVQRLVLTHIPPWHDPSQVLAEARPHFDGPLELATSGASWTVGADA